MKKVLFMSLAMAVALTGFAQKNLSNAAKNACSTAKKPSAVRQIDGSAVQGLQFNMAQSMVNATRDDDNFEEYTAMTTNYDLQSNSALGNRIAVWPDGCASFTATWDHSQNTGFPDRGTGYNFYTPDTKGMGDEPEVRQEPVKSGWPSIASCGNGELLASHATGVNLYYRPVKGQGDWQLIYNWGADYGSPTWPRVICSGPDDQYIHLVFAKQISVGDGYDNHVYYVRSTDRGQTWSEMIDFPGVDNDATGEYRNQLSADDYVMAANGNDVAVMFGGYTTELFYMISHDNGETWERQIIAPYPIMGADGNPVHAIDFDDYPDGMIDSIQTNDNSFSIAIDNNGVVHAACGLFHWKVADSDSYTYWPVYGFGIMYWNSNYTNPQGGHEIPIFGTFSGDANHPEWQANGLGYTLMPDRLMELAEADGNEANLRVLGLIDEDGDGYYGGYENSTGASWHYRSLGCATMPGVSVDENGNVVICYSVWSEVRINEATNFSYRSVYVSAKDSQDQWFDDAINLSNDFIHYYMEQYPCTASPVGHNNSFWILYSEDDNQGLYLDISDTYPNSNGGVLTENTLYAVKITPNMPGYDGVEEAVNPMTSTRVYPNPATDVLNIEVNASQASEMNISVYNIMGQNVMNKNVNINTGINRPSISTAELNSGIYFVTVKANGFENTMKFIVK